VLLETEHFKTRVIFTQVGNNMLVKKQMLTGERTDDIQKKYVDFFSATLEDFGVDSPSELSSEDRKKWEIGVRPVTNTIVQLKDKDIKSFRETLWEKNKGICPLLKTQTPKENMTLDHIHKLKSEPISEQKGTIRDAIDFRANAMEGKITNNWKRYFGSDENKYPISLPNYLRNLADYLERGAYQCEDGNYYAHPNEAPPIEKLGKAAFNKIKKAHKNKYPKRKDLVYPKSGKLTISWKRLMDEFGIQNSIKS